jgi:uroporphyrinogen III methyltransferase/synthase
MSDPAQPLAGRRIVVTRARAQAGDLVARLRELGAEPLECPAITIVPPASYAPLNAAISQIAQYNWIIFTSVNGVAAFLERLRNQGHTPDVLRHAHVGAIGPATAAALAAADLPPHFVPDTYVAEAVVAQIGDVAGKRILLPRADLARTALADGLGERGALVDEVTAYRTMPAPELAQVTDLLRAGTVDALTFTSSSTVRYFLAGLEAASKPVAELLRGPQRPAVVCIGPITAATAREQGLAVDAVAEEYTTTGLIAILVRWFVDHAAVERT